MITLTRIAYIAVLMALAPITYADGLWGNQAFDQFCERLPLASRAVLARASKGFLPVLDTRANLDMSAIRIAAFEDIEPVLTRAVHRGMSTLDLFTQPELARTNRCALFLDKTTLSAIDRMYALHGIWELAARPTESTSKDFRMDYLVVGQGHLVIGYPAEADVLVDDESGDLRPYRYEPYISADIVSTGRQRGLFDIRTLTRPNGKFEPFEGTFGAEIHGFELDGNNVLLNYTFAFEQNSRLSKTPITRKNTYVAQR